MFKKSLFIFRRDFRIEDNTGLIQSLNLSQEVMTIFIFDPIQISDKNKFRSPKAIRFIIESLKDLENQLEKYKANLHIFYSDTIKTIEDIIKSEKIDSLFINKDYTPFSISRDNNIEKLCKKLKISFNIFDDLLLNPPQNCLKSDKSPYTVFTPFYKNASKLKIKAIQELSKNLGSRLTQENSIQSKKISAENNKIYLKVLSEIQEKIKASHKHPSDKTAYIKNIISPGRSSALKILKNLKDFNDYNKTHDIPSIETTHLSAHLKYGTVSAREAYHAISNLLGRSHDLIKQLYWRDFFTYIIYYFPNVIGSSFHEKYNKIHWSYDKEIFKKWCSGQTGFPIVDAGMRQLNQTGFMHNRVRMIVASFLVKDLHIDWQWGEKYFAQNLIDYDVALNNGNWQWSASTGCDAQPYFRIFNPWIQQKRFDPHCEYIKKWVSELRNINNKDILNWYKTYSKYNIYYKPIIDHAKESKISKSLFTNTKLTSPK